MIRRCFGNYARSLRHIPFGWNGYSRIDLFNLYAYNSNQTENKHC